MTKYIFELKEYKDCWRIVCEQVVGGHVVGTKTHWYLKTEITPEVVALMWGSIPEFHESDSMHALRFHKRDPKKARS